MRAFNNPFKVRYEFQKTILHSFTIDRLVKRVLTTFSQE